MNKPDDKKKIIVDEDWKSQVQREKEQWKQSGGTTQDGASESASASDPSAAPEAARDTQPKPTNEAPDSVSGDGPQPSPHELPPPSFEWLVTSLATQAFMSLGQIPDPVDGQLRLSLELAKHHIDLLTMLEKKTQGNLTQEESQLMDSVLHQLRLVFVSQGGSAGS